MLIPSADALNTALGITLSPEQWDAVGAELEPAVMVAGAGSGKTMAMAARVAWLVGSGQIPADRVLGLTFTNKAAGELVERVRHVLTQVGVDPDREPVISTYHAFADRILAEHGIRIGREPTHALLSDAAAASLAYRLVCHTDVDLSGIGSGPVEVTKKLLQLDSELVELDIEPARLRAFDEQLLAQIAAAPKVQAEGKDMRAAAERRIGLSLLVEQWRARKAESEVFDFGDQIRLANHIVREFPAVAREIRDRFDVVLLDEYQDTSIAQRHLLEALFGAGHPITAVGDPCQAIYGWRGASVQNIEYFPEHFKGESEVAEYPLSVNRRSGAEILRVANIVAADLRQTHRAIRELSAVPERGDGQVRCGLFRTFDEEIDWVVRDIVERGAAGRWSDFAVLATTTKGLSAINHKLRAAGVPTQLIGAAALLKQPVVVEILSLLEVLADPTANAAMIRILTNARWAIGTRDLVALGERARHLAGADRRRDYRTIDDLLQGSVSQNDPVERVSLVEALADPGDPADYSPEAYQRFTAIADQLNQLRMHLSSPVTELVSRVIDISGIGVEIELGADPLAIVDRRRAVRTLLALTSEVVERGHISLAGFLAYLHEAERLDAEISMEPAAADDAVRLMTTYKAKGLEFAEVYVPFLSLEAFPGHRKRGLWLTSPSAVPWPLREDCPPQLRDYADPADGFPNTFLKAYRAKAREIQQLDDRRLAYVAMTRAERSLTVTGHWWGPTQSTRRGPHEFLALVHDAVAPTGVVHWVTEDEAGPVNPSPNFTRDPMPWPTPSGRTASVREQAARVREAVPPSTWSERATRWRRAADVLIAEERQRRAKERTVQLPDAVSASTWIRAQVDPAGVAASIARPMPTAPSRAAERGTRVHAWIESRLGQQSLIDPFDLPGSADDDIATDDAVEALQRAFDESEFANRTPAATEHPFAIVIDGRVIRGRIDAVFREGDRYLVVDWKTGRSHDALQLAIYRAAWAQIANVPIDQVDAAFFIIGPNEVIRPDDLPELAVDRPLGH